MSINVNVSGNPIRINRGKLVTATDLDYDKKEFDKRRRMRLEQVRHQSKEIAENVRNKVRKEKKKQLSDFEKREEEKLKQWQNRKLLELQQQYRESLKNIGLGHTQAIVEDTQENIAAKRLEELKEKAKERGQKARQKVQSEKNRESLKKAIPEQHKKLTRDVENARSSMVAKTKKTPSKKRKKKTKTNINITTNVSSSGASESGVEELDLVSDSDLPTVSEMSETGARRKRSKSKSPNSTYRGSSSPAPTIFTKADVHQVRRDSPKRSKSPLFQSIPDSSTDVPQYQEDTRISDRIMNRRYLLNPGKPAFESLKKDMLEVNEVMTRSKPYSYVSSEKRVDKSISTKIPENLPSPVIICQCNCRCNDHRDKDTSTQTEIPSKPTVSLKDLPRPRDLQKSNSKVQYYDHKNRFSKEMVAPKGSVKKISEENIDVCCHLCQCQEKQFQDKQFKNDRDAEIRGRKASEKANVHKDYKQMLKQLPVLQKQERLARMAGDKPIFHMDNERLQDHERSKQNRMENAYERHFPKTITIPPKKHVIEKEPFKAVDMTSKPNTDTLPETSKWDEGRLTDNGFTLTRDSGNIVIETDVAAGSNKEDYLKYLLDRLKLQKEMLLREAANLPLNSNLSSIISGLESLRKDQTDNGINVRDTLGMTVSKLENELPLPDTTNQDTTEKKTTKHKRFREQIPSSTSSSSTGSSPTKRRKHRKYRIVLQNTSTQTSPKTIAPETKPSTEDIQATTKDKVPSTKISPTKKPSVASIRSDRASKTKSAPKDRASSPIRLASPIADKQGQAEKYQKCKCKEELQKMRATGEKDKSDVCEIVIKIQENEAPEISVKSPKKQGKDIIVKEISTDEGTSKNRKRFVKIDEIASTGGILKSSWRKQFSRSDPAATSTSTSYFSPPDYSKSDFSRLPTAESTGTGKSYRSSAQARRKIDPRLLTYIRKLLTMSRSSIDELGVSSASDFSTPSVTLTSDDSKYSSLNQLRSIIRYFNLNPQELAHYLSYSEDGTSTSISTKTPSTVHSSDYEASKSHVDANVQGSSNGGSKSSAKTTPSPMTQRSTPTPAAQYADLANLCEKRIAELAAMIDQVRMEKQQILSPTQSDKENSTQYMVLPSHSDRKSPNTSSELEQAEINKRLLEIDYSLAEQLKVTQRHQDSVVNDEEMSELDKELLARYRKLVNVQISDDKTTKKERLIQTVEFDDGNLEINKNITSETIIELPSPFTPILLDIPRLPKLISSVENSNEKTKKPPPAKGLMAAKRFNEDITTVAHELSTIIEVDSQLSTRLRQSSSPKPETAPIRTSVDFDPTAVLPEIPPERNEDKAKSDGSVPDIVAEIGVSTEAAPKGRSKIVQIQNEPEVIPTTSKENIIGDHKDLGIKLADIRSEDSSTDKSEMDNIEIMLRSMGMGWAVSTLRKTKATFDMPSTSSSAGTITTPAKDKSNSSDEDNLKQSSNTSDVTLRDMLGRKIFYTSSTNSEAQTPSLNLTKALTDLSVIQGSARSSDNKNQRTSTPIHTTKSSESKKEDVVTAGESELSSVKISDEFLTMPDSTNNSSAS